MEELEALVQAAQEGDREAFAELCRRFRGLVASRAGRSHLRCLREEMEAEGWLAFAEAVQTYRRGSGRFEGYAAQRVHYALWNAFQKERRRWRREVGCLDAEEASEPAAPVDVAQTVEDALLRRELERAPGRKDAAAAGGAAGGQRPGCRRSRGAGFGSGAPPVGRGGGKKQTPPLKKPPAANVGG